MTADEARVWLIKTSLGITAATFLFFIISPALGFPLRFDQAVRMIEIIMPVFIGYLGNATQFIFLPADKSPLLPAPTQPLLGILTRGPVLLFGVMLVGAIISFWFSNRPGAPGGIGMSTNTLAAVITVALSLLTVSTNVIVSYLFAVQRK